MEEGKVARILDIYTRLLNGESIFKGEAARHYQVSERSIQRDLEDIQIYLEEAARRKEATYSLVYDRGTKSYRIVKGL